MKTTIINETGNWNGLWTDALISELKTNTDNVQVGEHLILETEAFKVWSIAIPVGESLPFHKHNKPYFYTAIQPGKSRSFYADGKIIETEYEANDIKYYNDLNSAQYFIHNLENIGETTLIYTTVEFKK
ncbi:hypothetical protein [Formosa haliotis]|uniref:hypothetical protein n=1 Tax=Formosa haliotis TaxID=1555194 RepID=UPI000824FCCB|nr:hypothetical protein [Formosa haliotis]